MKLKILSILFFTLLLSYFLFSYLFPSNPNFNAPSIHTPKCDRNITPFYIYDLPERFNEKLLTNCSKLDPWLNKCPYIQNHGLGQPLIFKKSIRKKSSPSWYNTYQFSTDMIFHARAAKHPCRTFDLSKARMFYVPFYPSVYAPAYFLETDFARRDAMAVDLVEYISSFATFQRNGGRDHFLVSGIMAHDLERGPEITDGKSYRSNKLLDLEKMENFTVLIIERREMNKYKNHFGIPYPSYFHPHLNSEMIEWQNKVRRSERTHLFAFVGGARHKGHVSEKYRTAVINQCKRSESCLLLFCNNWVSAWDAADEIIGAMKRSKFCLQPPGDTETCRSVFDSILSGCVPVFFKDINAYLQYEWYIPENRTDWSVFIRPERLFEGRIEDVLARIPERDPEDERGCYRDDTKSHVCVPRCKSGGNRVPGRSRHCACRADETGSADRARRRRSSWYSSGTSLGVLVCRMMV